MRVVPIYNDIDIHLNDIPSQQTQNICLTFIECWINDEDVGPTL